MANPRNGMNNDRKNMEDDSKSNATNLTELDNSMEFTDNEEDEPLERSIPPEAISVLPPRAPNTSGPSTGGRYRRKRSTRHKHKSHRRKTHRRKTHRRKTHRRKTHRR
jgi:hypothetical protein